MSDASRVLKLAGSPPAVRWSTSSGIYARRRTGVPLFSMYARGVTLRTGFTDARAHLPAVLDLIASGRLHPERLATHVVDWEHAADALLTRTTKVVLVRS